MWTTLYTMSILCVIAYFSFSNTSNLFFIYLYIANSMREKWKASVEKTFSYLAPRNFSGIKTTRIYQQGNFKYKTNSFGCCNFLEKVVIGLICFSFFCSQQHYRNVPNTFLSFIAQVRFAPRNTSSKSIYTLSRIRIETKWFQKTIRNSLQSIFCVFTQQIDRVK